MSGRGTNGGLRPLLRLWLPLQGTWLMIALEAPFLAAVIARLPEPPHNLAAFGVAYAAAILVDLRFCRDGSLLRSLHLLPLLWFLEPAAAVAGAFGRTVLWRGRRYRLKSGRATLLHP